MNPDVADAAAQSVGLPPVAAVLFALIGGAISLSTPYLFVSLGECITERSGRVNLGLEGTMILGAVVGLRRRLPGRDRLPAADRGRAVDRRPGRRAGRRRHGRRCTPGCAPRTRVNDIAVGIALMIFGVGLAIFLGKPYIQPKAPHLPGALARRLEQPRRDPARRFKINGLFLLGLVLAPALAWALTNTRWGMILRMVGESADAARALGYSVNHVRMLATCAGGFLAGIGGSFLSLYNPGIWAEGLSRGQGLMAVALVIFARWNPLTCLFASLMFGAAEALGPALQSAGLSRGYQLYAAVPAR